jgi:GTPase SAR1 family protein
MLADVHRLVESRRASIAVAQQQESESVFKLILAGAKGSGKTSLLQRFVYGSAGDNAVSEYVGSFAAFR